MKRRVGYLVLAGICVLCISGCGKSKEVEERQMELRSQGMQQALQGDYEAAVASYDEALGLADMRAGALELDIASYKASALYHTGELEKAIDTCTAVLDLKKSAEMYLTRGLLYREAENVEAANADFASAIKMTSQKDQIMLGRLSYYMEDYIKAKEYLEAASEAGNPEGDYWQAELYWQMGNTDYAITLYQSYLERGDVQHQSAYAKVASWQMEQGDYDGALSTLEEGIAKGEGESLKELLADEIAVYERKSDFATAKLKIESYLEKYPDDEKAEREYEFLKSR